MESDTEVPRVGSAILCEYEGIINPSDERLLWHLEDDTKKNVVDEIVFDMDLDEILEARDALFTDLVNRGAIQYGANRLATPKGNMIDIPYQNTLRPIMIPWTMIRRRVPSIAAEDLCDLYLSRLDPSKGFPAKMLRTSSKYCEDDTP